MRRGAPVETAEVAKRSAMLEERLRRMRDLYELGDLSRAEYIARRDVNHGELAELAPEPLPDLTQAERVLDDFGIFCRQEHDPDAKRRLLQLVFERVWLDGGRVVAVRPKPAFAPFLQKRHHSRCNAMCKERSDGRGFSAAPRASGHFLSRPRRPLRSRELDRH